MDSATCQEQPDIFNETDNMRRDLQHNRYLQHFVDSVINSMGSSHPDKAVNTLGSLYIHYVKSISEKSKLNTVLEVHS
jgi:hypothetical protein